MQDELYMARALKLAQRGRFTTHPNPNVGCVIVNHGEIVGEGYHHRAGEPHAEVHALRMAGEKAKGATAYVTLEPCSHHGRTPPCAEALARSGVARVVVAMQHSAKGESKIVARCTLPLTAQRRVDLIVTDLAVIEPGPEGLILRERAPGIGLDHIRAATDARLIVMGDIPEMALD